MSNFVPNPASLRRRTLLIQAGISILAVPSLSVARYLDDASRGFPIQHSDAEWRRILGNDRFRVMREASMETPLSSELINEARPGLYLCAGCGAPLFSSEQKLVRAGAWPTFSGPTDSSAISLSADPDWTALFHRRIYCARCGGYLGMVFTDGADGFRFAINGLALKFVAAGEDELSQPQPVNVPP